MNNSQILRNIASTSYRRRARLQRLVQLHAEAQCNGDYYKNDDGTFTHNDAKNDAKEDPLVLTAEKREADIRASIAKMCGCGYIPDFITYNGDPRGFVLKILADKLGAGDVDVCRKLGFMRDWGGDYSFIKEKETFPILWRMFP